MNHWTSIYFVFVLCVSGSNDNYHWDFLMLVQEWPQTTCMIYKDQPCKVPKGINYFTIHGLWPQRNDGTWPQFCPGPTWNGTELEPIRTQLDDYWPSYFSPPREFWDHEWSKHGTCVVYNSTLIYELYDYFQTTLTFRNIYDVTKVLEVSEIVPSDDVLYQKNQVTESIVKYFGVMPKMQCYNKFLHGIVMCFDDQLRLKNCSNVNLDDTTEDIIT